MKTISPPSALAGVLALVTSSSAYTTNTIGFRAMPQQQLHPPPEGTRGKRRQRRPYASSRSAIVHAAAKRSGDNSNNNNNNNNNNDPDAVLVFATDYHAPVMWRECIEALLGETTKTSKPDDTHNRCFVDGTLGGGGHSAALLSRLGPGDLVLGCDVDPNALHEASQRLQHYIHHDGSQAPLFVPVETNFGALVESLSEIRHPVTHQAIDRVDGILLDFGVSSHQIDTPERGFAFMKEGPLDMRMTGAESSSAANNNNNNSRGITAADICNEFDVAELQRIFSVYGDEPRSKTIARAVVEHRPLSTTQDLVQAIASVTPSFAKNKRMGKLATCARIFQSLRIVVNQEDVVLDKVLSQACPALLRPGGRLVVLSYHSMEDRATKRIMRDGSLQKQRKDERDIYGNYVGPPKPFKPVGKRQRASETEVETNPRARSAVLRVAERTADV